MASWQRAAVLSVLAGCLAAFGCKSLDRAMRVGQPPEETAPQKVFLEGLAATQRYSAERRAYLGRTQWPHVGPRVSELKQAAIIETLRRGKAMLMDARTVAMNVEPTEDFVEAIKEEDISSPVVHERELRADQTATATFVRLLNIDYHAKGQAAIARVVIRRSKEWTYEQHTLFLLRGEAWALQEVLEP